MTGTIHRICNEEEGMYGELGSHQRAAGLRAGKAEMPVKKK